MVMKSLLLLPAVLLVVSAQTAPNSSEPVKDVANYVVKLHLKIRKDSLGKVLVSKIYNSTAEDGIQTADVVELFRLHNISYEQISAILRDKMSTIDWLENMLNLTGVSFKTFYEGWIENLGIKANNLQEPIINALGLDAVNFSRALTFDSANIYGVLKEGNYSDANIDRVLNISGKTIEQVFESARDIIVRDIKLLNYTYFIDHLKKVQFQPIAALYLWTALGITEQDVYNVTKFRNITEEIVDNLNKINYVGVITNNTKIVLPYSVYPNILKHDFIRIVTNNGLNVSECIKNITRDVVECQLSPNSTSYIEIARNLTTKNCTYVTYVGPQIITEQVLIETNKTADPTWIKKRNETVFILGSPLICNQQLYGLAFNDNGSYIGFSPLITVQSHDEDHHQHNHTHTVTPRPSGTAGLLGTNSWSRLLLACSMLFLAKY